MALPASRYNTVVRPIRRFFFALSVISLLLLGSCSTASPRRGPVKAEKERKPAPEFELKDSMGRTAKLSDYRGKVVLLNFWATWCGPCKIEIPWFVEFEQTFKDKGFAVLGVSMDEDGWDAVKPYLKSAQVNYRVVLGTDSVAQLYGGVDSLPTSFMIDQEGRIAAIHVGLVRKGDYQNDINHLLGLDAKSRARAGGGGLPAVALFAR